MSVRLGLKGRCALVTVETSDVGGACVERLRDEGMLVAVAGADRAGADRAVEQALELSGARLDVLVVGGETLFEGSIEATPEAAFRELLEVNLTWPFQIGRACFRVMRRQGGGSMIHIAPAAGIRADHDMAACSVMSAGLIAVAELFAAEGMPHGVRSNVVCPGRGTDVASTVASTVAWLASEESAHMSGATLRIDDGAGAAMLLDTRT